MITSKIEAFFGHILRMNPIIPKNIQSHALSD